MEVQNRKIAFTRTGSEALKHKLLISRDVEQGQIFGGRTDKNQIIILCVVKREQSPTLYPKRTVEQIKNAVQLMDRQHFSDRCVMRMLQS